METRLNKFVKGRVLLYRVKGNDRDACAYVDVPLHRNSIGNVCVSGNCYCSSFDAKCTYDDVDTFLTKEEFDELVTPIAEKACSDDPSYNDLLLSERQEKWEMEIRQEEMDIIADCHNMDEDKMDTIVEKASEIGVDLDRSMVDGVYRNKEDLGEELAEELSPYPHLCRFFDFEAYAEDIMDNDYGYVELSDERIVKFVV